MAGYAQFESLRRSKKELPMITALDFLLQGVQGSHRRLKNDVTGLTLEQLHWRPHEGGFHIGFALWHTVRTEDNVVNFVIQRQPTIWMAEAYDQLFSMDSKAQGTGMSDEEVARVRIPPLEEFMPYAEKVWQASEAFVAGLDPAQLEEMVTIRPVGERRLRDALFNMLLTHNYLHLGEIDYIKGLQGIGGTPY